MEASKIAGDCGCWNSALLLFTLFDSCDIILEQLPFSNEILTILAMDVFCDLSLFIVLYILAGNRLTYTLGMSPWNCWTGKVPPKEAALRDKKVSSSVLSSLCSLTA